MSDVLKRATITPYDAQGNNLEELRAITFDFNPESLTIQVANAQESPGKRSRQRVQYIGESNATLSFDAYFDTSRPGTGSGGQPGQPETGDELDVRHRTMPLANLLQGDPPGPKSAQRIVQFNWGRIIFDGLVRSYNEVLDYFSPDGIPLRAKVSLSIEEHKRDYQIPDSGRKGAPAGNVSNGPGGTGVDPALSQLGATIGQAGEVAAQNGLDSLLDLAGQSGLTFDAGAAVSAPGVPPPSGPLGAGVDLAFSAGAGIDLPVANSLAVFGAGAIDAALGADVDLSRSGGEISGATKDMKATLAAKRPSGWAPQGPVPGSATVHLAAAVVEARTGVFAGTQSNSSGGAFSATRIDPASPPARSAGQIEDIQVQDPPPPAVIQQAPVPVIGSPPTFAPRYGPGPGPALFAPRHCLARTLRTIGLSRERRPSWERLPDSDPFLSSNARFTGCCNHRGGCRSDSH